MIAMESYDASKRRLLGYIAKTAAAVALGSPFLQVLAGCSRETIPTPAPQSYNLTLGEVKLGFAQPGPYVAEKSSSMPEIIEMKRAGMLADVIYNPSDSELQRLLGDLFDSHGIDRAMIKDAIDTYKLVKDGKHGHATVLPGLRPLFGAAVPMYIAFTPKFVAELEGDEEFRMTVRHESRHVKDFYNGIKIGDYYIKGAQPDITNEFIENIGELRASHGVSTIIYKMYKENGKLPVTAGYFANELHIYSGNWKLVKDAKTETEKRIAESQLAEFSDIVPVELGNDSVRIDFTLGGVKEFFEVRPR